MLDTAEVKIFLGLDVGKSAHHGHGLTPAGKVVFDKQLPNSEPSVLFAMLRDGTFYEPRTPAVTLAA